MIFLSLPLNVVAFMLGGQINKIIRPIAVPLILLILSWSWYALPVLIYGVTLTLGYGENSKLMKWLKSEQKVRIVLGLLNAIPIPIIVIFTHNWIALLGIPIIVGNWCIRLGSWGKIGKYDILPVDIFRGLALSASVVWALKG